MGNMYKPGKPPMIPNVAWWKVGKEALATTEWPSGNMIDVLLKRKISENSDLSKTEY